MNAIEKSNAVRKKAAHAGYWLARTALLSFVALFFPHSSAMAQSAYLPIRYEAPIPGNAEAQISADLNSGNIFINWSGLSPDIQLSSPLSEQEIDAIQVTQAVQAVSDDAPQPSAEPSTAQSNPEAESGSGESMPSSLTNPVLPNVPSSLNKGDVVAPPVEAIQKPQTATKPENSARKSTEHKPEQRSSVRSGPKLRKSFSALFTEQRPFLLYSQDASITYLMPNALVDHPSLGRYLRGILEQRALTRWQDVRGKNEQTTASNQTNNNERPTLVITGRIEDRFYSPAFSSLYLDEQKSVGDKKYPNQILSFNYSHKYKKPFGLSDLFSSENDKTLNAPVELIAAYIQADIVRQKTIRLGTQVAPEQDAWLKDLEPSLELLSTFTLVPSRQTGKIAGLNFHFNPGILGAEADGSYDVFVPAAIFSPSLSNLFADAFGGEALRASRYSAKGFSTASVNLDGLKSNAELGGNMQLEGEIPGNWCDGFHLTLTDKASGQIVTEGLVQLLPELPPYGLAGNMIRFRAELSVSGVGGKDGFLMFEPYPITVVDGRVVPRADGVCQPDRSISLPDTKRDMIAIPVIY